MTFEKYHKIKRLGDQDNEGIFSEPQDQIVIEEKIDGGNFRFMINNGVIIFGSRTQQLTSNEGEELNVGKNFRQCLDFVKGRVTESMENSYTPSKMIFYGECCKMHTMRYDWDKIPPYLGFDIKDITDPENTRYLDNDEKLAVFKEFGLPTVPLIKVVKAGEITEYTDKDVPVSVYAPEDKPEQQAEGVVFKNYSKQLFAKYVRDQFKEENAKIWGGNPKYNKVDDTNDADLVFKYCTNARIDKMVFKLIDEGHVLEMALMKELPKRVYEDICEEEWHTIMQSHWKIDFSKVRRLIAKRCVTVLNQIITNNALERKEI